MSDNPGMAEIEKFDKSKLKMTETHEKKIYRLQKKQLNRRTKRENRNEARATNLYSTFRKHCLLILPLLALYLCKMQRGWIKFK